ncbi:MAG TPA: glycoside hydrolase family 73 protein [Bacteroidales bacterium]|nr:glycoside hydrolase family 73 protein [Lentimicrobiaceae bacterium]HOI01036.1 glycoside hydrolase family 73 protein [Bacteroidales bacterium]
MDKKTFIERFSPVVVQATSDTGLFPSVMMAQAALESAWGSSKLSSQYNNFFGIKADRSWNGPVVNLSTGEFIGGNYVTIMDGFRVYTDPVDSFMDRIKFLKKNPRYKPVFEAKTPEEQAQKLQAAGYATDPQYASKIISTIRANRFTDLDVKKN